MRSFPRTARHRLAAAVAAVAMAVGALAIPLANAEDLKDRQKQVQKQVRSARHDLGESSRAMQRATVRLEAAQAELGRARAVLDRVKVRLDDARERDREMKERLAAAVQRLAAAEKDLVDGRIAMEGQRDVVTDVVTSIYEDGDPELLAFAALLDAQTPADLTRRMEARNVMVGRETRAYDELRAAEVLLEVRQSQVKAAKQAVAEQQRAAAAHLVTMRGLHQEAIAARSRVQALVADRRDARQEASRARARDERHLVRLKRQEERIRRMILERARKAKGGGYRAEANGFLNRPTNGIVTSPYGYRRHPIYRYWGLHDGTDFRAGCGQALTASASGTVIARYYSPVWGNRLYLSVGQVNGKNLTVVYNHASGYRVGLGQRVERGQVVGVAGNTGWSTACHLHFTVLVNGRPVDPMNWI